ncbi:hypothetical protein [Streptomyces sp. uw30]|uniref:hypothetical protein n=1 Tax=Streptomyces sp. uw30 TaxID=1828179 RepID=UPI0021C8126D|nr:hypothetical protein [Streptomyces sp. uw30]
MSEAGRKVAFQQGRDVRVRDLGTGATTRVKGAQPSPAGHPSVNADGTVVAFESASPDLVEGDTNGVSDVFLRTVH